MIYNIIAISILVVFVAPLSVYAQTSNIVYISPNAAVSGCEATSTCYEPNILSINAGDAVQWINPPDNSHHTITSGVSQGGGPDGTFDTGLIQGGDSFSFVFSNPGKYPYFCGIHPWMTGTVLVSDGKTTKEDIPVPARCTDTRLFFSTGIRSEPIFEDFEKYCKYTKTPDDNFSYLINKSYKKPQYATYGITDDTTKGNGLYAILSVQRGGHGDRNHHGQDTSGNLNVASFLPSLYIFSAEIYSDNLHGSKSSSNVVITFFTKDDKKKIIIVPHRINTASKPPVDPSIQTVIMYLNEKPSQHSWEHMQYDLRDLYRQNNFGNYSDVTHWNLSIGGGSYTSQLNMYNGWDVTIDNILVSDGNFILPSPTYQKTVGISPLDILCNNEKSLAFKISDYTPICVNDSSIDKLFEVEFAVPLDDTINKIISEKMQKDKDHFKKLLADAIPDKPVIVTSSIDKIHEYTKYNHYKRDLIAKISPIPDYTLGSDWLVSNSGTFVGEVQSGTRESGQWSSTDESSRQLDSGAYMSPGRSGLDYSTTNVQILGVDEPDFVKNDANQIHVISSDKNIITTDYSLQKYHNIITRENGQTEPHDLFLYGDHLVVLSEINDRTDITIFDISSEPFTIQDQMSIDGTFYQGRMIDDVMYVITESELSGHAPLVLDKQTSQILSSPQIHYFTDKFYGDPILNTVTAIRLSDMDVHSSTFVLGEYNITYVSENNIYFSNALDPHSTTLANLDDVYMINKLIDAMTPYEMVILYQLSDKLNDTGDISIKHHMLLEVLKTFDVTDKSLYESLLYQIESPNEVQSTIHKIGISGTDIMYHGSGNVPGSMPNQFALDQDGDHLRVVTTSWSHNLQSNVYVLDDTMSVVGSLEDIAPGETLHSTRFADNWLYLVTFRQVDPFFVIDVSSVQPKILGELKIPGYSTYLQNYDDTHVIGIGYDTNRNQFDDTVESGIKISMFDVTDFANPTETDNVIIGNTGTSSAGTLEHKAVFIDSANKLVGIPVLFEEKLIFYVYSINDDYTLQEHSQIPHEIDLSNPSNVRMFYMGDVLYTVTPKLIKANSIVQQDYTVGRLHLETDLSK